jgi:hypothetical protein
MSTLGVAANGRYRCSECERWYLLKVRQGFEPVAAQALRQKRIKVFIPVTRRNKSQRSRFGVPGYLFCRFDLRRQQAVLGVPGSRCIVGIPEPVALDDYEIVALQKILLAKNGIVALLPHFLHVKKMG